MKTLLNRLAGSRALGSGGVATATILLLAAVPVTAQTSTPYTSTGWITGVPVPGIWCTNGLGQVLFRGNAHLVRVQSSDPRLTGQRLIFVDGAAQADGSAIICGTAYQEVGAWDLADPQNPQFTPTGGLWETTHRGVMQADNSLQLNIVSYGSGGTIDGLRMEETLTRAAAAGPIDPTVPYLYTGTIKAAPVSTNLVLDDFNSPAVGWTFRIPRNHRRTRRRHSGTTASRAGSCEPTRQSRPADTGSRRPPPPASRASGRSPRAPVVDAAGADGEWTI